MSQSESIAVSPAVSIRIDTDQQDGHGGAHPRAIEQAKERSGDPSAALVLRFYEVTLVEFDGKNATETFDAPVDGLRGNYYINLWSPKKTLIAELGMKSGDGSFCPVARSNPIDLPRDAESAQYAEKFSTVLPSTDSSLAISWIFERGRAGVSKFRLSIACNCRDTFSTGRDSRREAK